MIHWMWRLSEESGGDNLGLVCTDQGLLLGGTALIEERNGCFVVRERGEIEQLLSQAYGKNFSDRAARDAMMAFDVLIKYARDTGSDDNWNPALHPRAGTPPNPGWFAPTGGMDSETSAAQTVQNNDPTHRSDVAANASPAWVRLRPGPKRIDELADFAEWFANATPEDGKAIRAEIKRYFRGRRLAICCPRPQRQTERSPSTRDRS